MKSRVTERHRLLCVLTISLAMLLLVPVGVNSSGPVRPTPTPAEEILDVPSRSEVGLMLQRNDFVGALAALAKIREAAYRGRDTTQWFATLLEETRLLTQNGPKGPHQELLPAAYENAIRFVEGVPAPNETDLEVGKLTLIADLHIRAAKRISGSQNQNRMAEVAPHLEAADARFAQAFAKRVGLGTVPRHHQLYGFFGQPHHTMARDAVTYSYAALLTYRAVLDVTLKGQIAGLDAASLLHLGIPDPGANAHPLVRAVALLDDLERWHAQAGRREEALEARLERDHVLYALLPAEERRLVVEDLRRRLPAFRDVTWWSMGMAELALDVNDTAESPTEALAIAEEGARLFPASPGGKDCAAIAKVIRLDLDDPHASVGGVPTASPLGPVLSVRHRGPAVVYFRAGYRPDATVDDLQLRDFFESPWNYRPAPSPPAPHGVKVWDVELAAPAGGREIEDLLEMPVKHKGLYRVEASLVPGLREARVASVPVLVTDLILTIFDDRDDLCVRALSASSGRPVEGTTVRMLESVSGTQPTLKQLGNAITAAEGLVRFARPKQRAHLVVVGHRGEDAARAALPFDLPPSRPELPELAGTLVFDHTSVSTGQSVRWRALVRRRDSHGTVLEPAAGVPVTLSLRWSSEKGPLATARGVADAFGTAVGELTFPGLPTGARPDGWWECDLERAENRPGSAPQKLSTTILRKASPPSNINVMFDQSPAPRVGNEVRFSGRVIDRKRRPIAGARVSWQVQGPSTTPPPPWEREHVNRTVVVGSGEMVTGGDGRFRGSARVSAFPKTTWYAYSLGVTARDAHGQVVTVRKSLTGGAAAVHVGIREASIARAGEAVSLLLNRSWTADGTPAPGSSTVRVLRQPQYPEVPVAEYDMPLPDRQVYPSRPMLSYDAAEKLLGGFPDGPEVWRTTVRHDVHGLARVSVRGLPPGLYRAVIESADGSGGTARGSHPVVVAGPGVRVPAPLVLLDGVEEEGPRRVYVAGNDPEAPVVLDLLRPDRPLETRLVEGGTGVVVDLSGNRERPVVVRATIVHRGRIVSLEKSLEGRRPGFHVTFESFSPALVIRVTGVHGALAGDVEVIVVASNDDHRLYELNPHWPARCSAGAILLSNNGLGVYTNLVPKSASEWGTVAAPRIYAESLAHLDFQPPPAMCGTTFGPPPLPTLPSLAALNAMPSTADGQVGSPFVDEEKVLWEPRLRPDAAGRIRLELRPPAPGRAYRVAVAAVARNGQVGFADTVIRGPEARENKP